MRRVQIGWVIVPKATGSIHLNVRVYATEATAARYARGRIVTPCYVDVPDDVITAKG